MPARIPGDHRARRDVLTGEAAVAGRPVENETTHRRVLPLLALAGWLTAGLTACQSWGEPQGADRVRHIHIQSRLAPLSFYAGVGEEIRWHNHSARPVQLSILDARGLAHLSCNKGFRRLGQFTELVTIAPDQHVSLCFSQPASLRYNVWLDPEDRRHSMTRTGYIRID